MDMWCAREKQEVHAKLSLKYEYYELWKYRDFYIKLIFCSSLVTYNISVLRAVGRKGMCSCIWFMDFIPWQTHLNEVVNGISHGVAGMVSCAEFVLQWQMENDHKVPELVEAVQGGVMYQGTLPEAGTRSHLTRKCCDIICGAIY
jgi:hypothetical protein